mmetsp:Transcript_68017/g.162433  ORF Transcript_68017/g.162433 Transcript_68017/m.162433 type:complete len:178 (+) Transcript_68017:83-616(+)
MKSQLAQAAALRKNFGYSRSLSLPDAKRDSSALPASAATRPLHLLRTSSSSMPQLVAQPIATTLFSRTQSSAERNEAYDYLPEGVATANRRTVEDRMRDWDNAEQTLTSAFFFVWAVGVISLGGWHVVSQFSPNLQVAVTCISLVAFARISRKGRGALALHPDTNIHTPTFLQGPVA